MSSRTATVIFEDDDAVIRMTVKERAPMMRRVARTHGVDLDWLCEPLEKDSGLSIKSVGTRQQLVDRRRFFQSRGVEALLQIGSSRSAVSNITADP